jgi:hypothetical protein
VVYRHTGKILKAAGYQVIVFTHAAHAGIRVKARNNRVSIGNRISLNRILVQVLAASEDQD